MSSDLRYAKIWTAIGWIAVSAATTLSLMPIAALPASALNDKFEHAVAYAMLTIWFCGTYSRSRYWVIAAGLLFMGITIEVLQSAMQWGRHADIHDFYANAAGVALGVLISWVTPFGQWARHVEALLVGRRTHI